MNNINRTSSKEAVDFSSLKQENHHHHHDKTKKQASTSSSSSNLTSSAQWLRSKDPRIVRVSRACGGKDRHSKVCTVRGLRDRRVRLSVSTAIQLYDLQERLGFNQPSKVVDWLLDAAKHEIDELPPLQIPPGSFNFCHQQPSMNNEVTISQQNDEQGFNINENLHHHHHLEASNSIMNASKSKEEEDRNNVLTRGNNHHHHHQASSFLGLLNTMPLGYNVNTNQWEEANNSSSDVSRHHLSGINLGFANQQTDSTNNVVLPFAALSSTLSLSTGPIAHHHQQQQQQPFFSSQFGVLDMGPRQMNQHQTMLSSSSNSLMSPSLVNTSTRQPSKPFNLSMMMMNPKLLRSATSSETQQPRNNKDQVFPSK